MKNWKYLCREHRGHTGKKLTGQFLPLLSNWSEIVVLCIGTMNVCGDSLGPLVGSRLLQAQLPGLHVYGTEQEPVHAMNLEETLQNIKRRHPDIPVLAVDAASGPLHLRGHIISGNGPLHPGAGLDKKLPSAGDAHITGVLGITGPFCLLSLRLASRKKLQKMVQTISAEIVSTVLKR